MILSFGDQDLVLASELLGYSLRTKATIKFTENGRIRVDANKPVRFAAEFSLFAEPKGALTVRVEKALALGFDWFGGIKAFIINKLLQYNSEKLYITKSPTYSSAVVIRSPLGRLKDVKIEQGKLTTIIEVI